MDVVTWIWLGVGLLLIAAELALPGLVVVFLGLAALLVGGLRAVGLVEGLPASMGVWVLSSGALTLGLRGVLRRYLPAEASRAQTDQALLDFGSRVEVVEACDDAGLEGRVRYQGTTWPAQALEGRIPVGAAARLVAQAPGGIGWIVEACEAEDNLEKGGEQ